MSPSGFLSTALAKTQVFFDDNPAPLLYASLGQLNAVVPFGVTGRDHTGVVITNSGQASLSLDLAVTDSAPALFTMDSTGQGHAAVLNQDGSLNGDLNPAGRGSTIVLYATGGGETSPAGIDGLLATVPLSTLVLPISARIDGKSADVLYAGGAPGFVAGVIQVNVRVPDDIAPGAVPILLQVGSALSQRRRNSQHRVGGAAFSYWCSCGAVDICGAIADSIHTSQVSQVIYRPPLNSRSRSTRIKAASSSPYST